MRELERIWPRGKFTLPEDWGDLSPDRDAEPIEIVGDGPEPSFEEINKQLFGPGHGPHFEDIPEH